MDRVALARHIIDFGLTPADVELGDPPGLQTAEPDALLQSAPEVLTLLQTQHDLHDLFPAGLAPEPTLLDPAPASDAPLPRADYLVVTWTVAELSALADVLTPGISRTSWHPYDRNFATDYLPKIRSGAPARAAQRLASYCPTRVDKSVLCIKSELHLNQDGISPGQGLATMPVADLFKQMIEEVQPTLVITTGTAGATYADHALGDVMITRAAKFRLRREFRNEPFADSLYISGFHRPDGHVRCRGRAGRPRRQAHGPRLRRPHNPLPPAGRKPGAARPGQPPAAQARRPGLPGLPSHPHHRLLRVRDVDKRPCPGWFGVEIGDAALGMVCDELGADAPRWLVVRNASDPQINGSLPTPPTSRPCGRSGSTTPTATGRPCPPRSRPGRSSPATERSPVTFATRTFEGRNSEGDRR